jgi:glutamate-1-semialdehyde 2,1-aminomutase
MKLHPAGLEILRTYETQTRGSATSMAEARRFMPGGNTRTTTFHPPYPVVFAHGKGPWLTDVDGRKYVDLFFNGLSLIHGHAFGPVTMAAAGAFEGGTAWSGASAKQIAFAELLHRRIPGAPLIRFTNSGSEATMLAVKIARHITGRPLILKFIGAYHGLYPDLEAGLYGFGEKPDATLIAPFNDLISCEKVLERHDGRVAAVIYEPVLYTGRVVTPDPRFLRALEALAQKRGILTILDDCLMFRLAVGGSAEKFGLSPDLTVLGKFIGGGTPVGVVAGRENLMMVLDPSCKGSIFHGGSFNGNVLGCAAGLATLANLTSAAIDKMDVQATALRGRLVDTAARLGLDVAISGLGSVGGIAFTSDPTRHEDDPSRIGHSTLFHLACLNAGVLLGPGGLFALATAVDDRALESAMSGMDNALAAIAPVAA